MQVLIMAMTIFFGQNTPLPWRQARTKISLIYVCSQHTETSQRGKKVQKIQEERTMSEGYEKKKNGGRSQDFDRLFVFGSD